MSREEKYISGISSLLPRSRKQMNKLFESDSEILEIESGKLLFTVDEFSDEDHFQTVDPYILGWNLAVATISDIFASGGNPAFFSHSMTIDPDLWDIDYTLNFTKGLADVLKKCGTAFIGGDFGFSENWSYTGIAFGNTKKIIKRTGAKAGDILFMTGTPGAGNTIAAMDLFKLNLNPHFGKIMLEIRNNEAKLISEYATCCMDSSDGMANALIMLSKLNHAGFTVDKIDYHPLGKEICRSLSVPPEILFLGECGEYELVFCIDRKDVYEFSKKAEKHRLNISEIGYVTGNKDCSVKTASFECILDNFDIRGRNYSHPHDYFKALIQYLDYNGNFNR